MIAVWEAKTACSAARSSQTVISGCAARPDGVGYDTGALELWFEDIPVPDHFNRPVVTTVDLHLSA